MEGMLIAKGTVPDGISRRAPQTDKWQEAHQWEVVYLKAIRHNRGRAMGGGTSKSRRYNRGTSMGGGTSKNHKT